VKRIQMGLSLMGGLLALTGALLLFVISLPLLYHNNAAAEQVFIGTDGCYTCHIDANSLWSDTLTPRVIEDAVMNPHAATITDALPIGAEGDFLPYRFADVDISMSSHYRFGTYQGSLP
jgi:hypothetical protein